MLYTYLKGKIMQHSENWRTIKMKWKRNTIFAVTVTIVVVVSMSLMSSSPNDHNTSSQTVYHGKIQTGNGEIRDNIPRTQNVGQGMMEKADKSKTSKAGDLSMKKEDKSETSKAGVLSTKKADKSETSKAGDLSMKKADKSETVKADGLPSKKADNPKISMIEDIPRKAAKKKRQTNIKFLEHMKAITKRANEVPRCKKPKFTKFMLLKLHRTGATVLESMIYRFGVRNNLTFVLPKAGANALSAGQPKSILPIKKGTHYDIFVCDSVYDATKSSRVLPADSLKMVIIRDPLDRMVSAAYYYRDVKKVPYLLAVPKENFIVNLIRDHSTYDTNEFSVTKNSMAKDFGFPQSTTRSMSKFISDYVFNLTIDFNVVLVLERLEESLVLMKKYMNWDLRDILFIPEKKNEYDPVSLNAADLAIFKSLNYLDYAIYEEFLRILDWKFKMESPSFKDEVDHFKTVLKTVKDYCNGESEYDFLYIKSTQWTCPFILYDSDCQLLRMDINVISMPILMKRHKKMHGQK